MIARAEELRAGDETFGATGWSETVIEVTPEKVRTRLACHGLPPVEDEYTIEQFDAFMRLGIVKTVTRPGVGVVYSAGRAEG